MVKENGSNPMMLTAIAAGGAFLLGLVIGLVVLGWGLWPVKYVDAAPDNLRADLQVDYLRMAIDSYTYTKDPVAALKRWGDMGDVAEEALKQVQDNPGLMRPEDILAFMAVVQAPPAPSGTVTPGVAATPTAAPSRAGSILRTALVVMCVVLLLLLVAIVLVFVLRTRRSGAMPAAETSAQEVTQEAGWTEYAAAGEEPPMAQFMATYKYGDDLFDDSFSIDSPAGEFLGECGVGISETIGVGEPKKVTAFEVWLFDKNDIQTVTKVLMSSHAFADEAIRQRLEAKGEPVPSMPGAQVVLETASLQLVARVVDMAYGEGAMPAESYFENLVLELAVWAK
jgi:hypothetical protein